jgi:hypothetical protein
MRAFANEARIKAINRRKIPTAPAAAVTLPGRSTAAHRYCSASSLKVTKPIIGK